MDTAAYAPDWLPTPVTTLFPGRNGRVQAAYIQLRPGKTVRVEQPDRNYPVFLYLGSDDLPNGIKFTAPISCEIESRILYMLRDDAHGSSVERRVVHSFRRIPPGLVEPTMHELRRATRSLQEA